MLSNTAHSLEDAKFFFDCEPNGALTCISGDRQEVVHHYVDAKQFFTENVPTYSAYREDVPSYTPTSNPLDFGTSSSADDDDVNTSFDTPEPDTSPSDTSSDFGGGSDSGSSDFGGGGSGGDF